MLAQTLGGSGWTAVLVSLTVGAVLAELIAQRPPRGPVRVAPPASPGVTDLVPRWALGLWAALAVVAIGAPGVLPAADPASPLAAPGVAIGMAVAALVAGIVVVGLAVRRPPARIDRADAALRLRSARVGAGQDGLLTIALHGTTSQLESLVQATRAATDPRPATARRALHTSRAADGSLLVRLRIPAERGEELMTAIDALVAQQEAPPLDEQCRRERPGQHGSAEPPGPEQYPGQVPDPRAARRLDALLDLVTGAVAVQRPTSLVVHVRIDEPAGPTTLTATTLTAVPDDRPAAWIEGGPAIPRTVAERLTCTAAVQALLVDRSGNPLYLGRTHRSVSRRQLRALRVRDRGRCVFPGCTTTSHLDAHHVRWWRRGGPTDLDNLALICRHHHPAPRPPLPHDRRGRRHLRLHPPRRHPHPERGRPHHRFSRRAAHPRDRRPHHHPELGRRTTRPRPRDGAALTALVDEAVR